MAINIWGIKIDLLTIKQITDVIEENIASKRLPMQVTGVNSETIIKSLNNKSLQLAINESDIVNIDGISVVIGLRILGFQIKERAACPDIFDILIDRANAKGYKLFFLGAKEKVVKEMIRKLQDEYSDLQIVGFHNGYFNEDNEHEVVKMIKASNADMLFLGIPSPMKELFIRKYLNTMDVPLCFGVGGVFDIKAGIFKRAPDWIQKIGMEWFYRFMQEPRRMWYRYLVGNSKFIWLVLKEKFIA
jgi:N-acetylglucosaminyldiphosphoundecaprenol N-acetyl-beta-D-mannosaminyltransferase